MRKAIRSAADLREYLDNRDIQVVQHAEDDVAKDQEAFVELASNVVIQISWNHCKCYPQCAPADAAHLAALKPVHNQMTLSFSQGTAIEIDYGHGILPDGHTYGVSFEPRNQKRSAPKIRHLGYYTDLEVLCTLLSRFSRTLAA